MSEELPLEIGTPPVIFSGVVSDFSLASQSISAQCTDAPVVNLYRLASDGSISESSPLATTEVDIGGYYSFNLTDLNISDRSSNIELLVKAVDCTGLSLRRPITAFNGEQNIDAKSTVISQVANAGSMMAKKLNEAKKSDIENLINSVSGTTMGTALDSLTTASGTATRFTEIFGTPPAVIKDVKPEIKFSEPTAFLNEQVVYPFTVNSFHVDPNYSFVYKWKFDGVLRSSSKTWNYIPHANAAGSHQIDLFIGKNDGADEIDLTKPYYSKTFFINIANSIQPTAPNISLHASTPTPRTVNTVKISLSTGTSMANCQSFSHMALTEDASQPGIVQFSLDCTTSGTQTVDVVVDSTNGTKTLYLWAMDELGVISLPKTVSFVLDTVVPSVTLNSPTLVGRGGVSETLTFSASDLTTGLSSLNLYFAADGVSFTHVSTISTGSSAYQWSTPLANTTSGVLRLVAIDAAGLSASSDVTGIYLDSTAPTAPSVTLSSQAVTQNSNASVTIGHCSDVASILLSESSTKPSPSVSGWQSCSIGAGALSTVVTGEGSHSIYAWAKDAVGNVAASSNFVQMNLDITVPVVSGPSVATQLAAGASPTVSWLVTDANSATVKLEFYNGTNWSTLTQNQNKVGSYNWPSVPSLSTSQAKLKVTATDAANNVATSESANFIIDSTAPVASSLVINSGVSATGNKNVLVNFSAVDDLVDITAFCLRYNNTATPSSGDSCWTTLSSISVTASRTISISNYQFQLGSVVGEYDVTVWYKNAVGLISALTSTSNVDSFLMNYSPDPPPTLSNILAAGFDNATSPLGVSDTTVTFGSDLYIKWRIADNVAIPAGQVSLYYTTNDTSFTTIITGLNNGINGSCTLSGTETGCYKWTAASPTNSYYRVKLVVTDSGGSVVFDVSNPLNTGAVKFLSGNTSLGMGGAATNAILFSPNESSYNDSADNQAIVVTKTGYVFYRSFGRGLVYVSPHDGIIRDVALQTGVASGDGGSAFNATFRAMSRMAIDYDDNVIIWDYNKVRKIDTHTTPWSISTLFGGGADATDGAAALSASISSAYTDQLTVTPNGRIYFNKTNEIWYYDPTDAKIKKHITLTGTGTDDMASWRATFDNVACPGNNAAITFNKSDSSITKIMRRMSASTSSSCGSAAATYPYYNTNFDLTTGVATAPHPPQTVWSSTKFTGLDGNIYVLYQGRGSLQKYNSATNTFVTVLGNGVNGRCADGTAALSCSVVAMSAFVNEFGRIYFVDLGVLRTVDSNGLVQTIAGQPRNFGIGYNPISARYSQIAFFDMNGNDIYIKNEQENQLVKFSLTGGNLEHIAGNSLRGSPTIGVSATQTKMPNCSWGMPCSFIVDSANNRIYHYASPNNVSYIDLATGNWVNQGSGVVQDSGTRVSYVGLNSDGLLIYAPSHYGVTGDKTTMRVVNQTNLSSTNIYGVTSIITAASSTVCVGVSTTTCTLTHSSSDAVQTRYKYDSTTGNWLFTLRGQNTLYSLPSLGGVATAFETMTNNFISYDFYKSGIDDFVFYCSTSGSLYKRNINTNVETLLPLPISSMTCASNSLFFNSSRNSLIFSYKQNNLYGIAEYTNP